MLYKHLFVLAVFIFGVLGCASTETVESTKVSPSEIYQSYIIEGSKDSTNVTVTFRVGGPTGSTVDLDAPGKIEHNGKEMRESAPNFLKGTDYHVSANEFMANHKFAYTDAGGKIWQNEISLQPLEITSKDLIVSKAEGGMITLSRAVGGDETLEFSIDSEKTPPTTNNTNSGNKTPELVYGTDLQFSFDASRTSIKIAPFSLKNFMEGKANISLTVRKNKSVQQSAKGGLLDISYQAQKISVNVVN